MLIGLAGGLVLACTAGARRADSAYARLLTATNATDLVMYATPVDFEDVRRRPEVADSAALFYVALVLDPPPAVDADLVPSTQTLVAPVASPDGGFTRLDRPKLISGRRPDPDRADEIGVNPAVARRFGLHPGSTLTVRSFAQDQLGDLLGNAAAVPRGPELRLTVAGIEVAAGEVVVREQLGTIHLTPAFLSTYADRIAVVPGLSVKLRGGPADLAAFKAGVVDLAGGEPVEIVSAANEREIAERGIKIEVQALRLFALLAAVASVLVGYQALARQSYGEADDHQVLRALGMSRPQLWAAAMLRSAAIAAVAAAVAVAGAVLASPALPFGRARLAEPSPGVDMDWFVLSVGAATIVALVLLLAAGPAWRATRGRSEAAAGRSPRAGRAGRLSEALARAGASPAAVVGVHMATDPSRGRNAVPVRAAIVGSSFSLAALVVALSFGASLDHLFNSPGLYGWTWDAIVGDPFGAGIADQARAISELEEVAAFSTIAFAEVEIDGLRTTGIAFDAVKGDVFPPVHEGRVPRQADEILLGTKDLEATGRSVGDVVTVVVGDRDLRMRIVGRGVLPAIGTSEVGGLGQGALLSPAGFHQLVPGVAANLVAVRFAPGTDIGPALRAVRDALGGVALNATARQAPVEVGEYGQVDRMPLALAGVLALIAAGTLAHALVTTIVRRRRELAILKTLGFVRGQVRSTLAWQATTIVGLALCVGVPLGLAAGRSIWGLFADQLGILPEPVVPWLAVAVTVAAALAAVNVIAAVPGRAAARAHPAVVLRSQ
ncbi:MAG TPA: FtsX-like permease family protein [Acidimicrobiales bacterium]